MSTNLVTAEAVLAVLSLLAAVYCTWRVGLVKAQADTIISLTAEVGSMGRRLKDAEHQLQIASTRIRLYRNQVLTLLELIRDHKIVGAASAARIIAQQLAEEDQDEQASVEDEDQIRPARRRGRA